MANVTGNSSNIIRSEVWRDELKERLLDDLMGQRYIDWVDFPDGTTYTIPTIGGMSTQTITEDVAVTYTAVDKGEFNMIITNYEGSAGYVTKKLVQDAKWGTVLENSLISEEHRALMERVETEIMKAPGPNAAQGGQTTANTNTINGAEHRFIGTGTNETIETADFAKAKYALKKGNVNLNGLIAIVDPSVTYKIETLTNIGNVSNNPKWEGIIETGMINATGMSYIKTIHGFDVWESNYLDTANETIGGLTTASGKQNLFFAANPQADATPLKGAWRQMPDVDVEYNKDMQRTEYVTTARWGIKLYRPENMVCVLTDDDQV